MSEDKTQVQPINPSEFLVKQIWEQLKLCYDPEIPVNIVDLGFIYDVSVEELTDEKEKYIAHIKMTLTTPGCSMADFILEEVRNRVLSLSKVKDVAINLVFDPPWDRSKMSMSAQLELGIV